MTKPYVIQKLNRLLQPLSGAGLCLVVASANLAHAQTLPQYSLPFNGTNQYAGVPNTAALEFTTGTIEMWVKPTWTVGTHSGANLCLISERSGANINGGTRFSLHMGNDMRSIGLWNGGSYQTVAYSFTKGAWAHVAAVMTTSSTQFYVNGVLIGTTANGINTGRAGYTLKIGVSETEGTAIGNAEYFEGEIDEVRVWNTLRTATQIQANYQAPVSAASAGLVAYYPIDNGITGASNATARLLKDYAASGYNGTLYNYWAEQAPTISSFSPARNAVSADRSGNMGVNFSQNMNSAAASDAAIKVFGSQTGKRAGTFAGGGTSAITFDPAQDLKPGESVSVTVTTAAKSMGSLTLATPQVMQFTGATRAATGTFGATNYPLASGSQTQKTAIGDLNNDGNLDLVALTAGNATASILLGTGTGTLGSASTYPTGAAGNDVALGDVNSDGKLDLVLTTSSGLKILLGTGTGAFGTATTLGNAYLFDLKLADMNADGILDAVSNSGGTLVVMLGTGTGGFGSATNYSLGVSNSTEIAIGDINNDGQLDVISANYNLNSYSILRGSPTSPGTLGTATVVSTAANYPAYLALGDVNGDGNLDLAISLLTSYNTVVMLGTGAGSFGAPTAYSGNGGGVTLADFTGDGNLDLLTASTGGLYVYKGTGSGTFAPATTTALSSYGTAAGDFNNDGRLDVASVSYDNDNASVLLNKASTPTITALSASSGMAGESVVLTGTNFTGATSVSFNGTAVTGFTVNSATQLTATVPAGATTGTVTVTTPNGTATSAQIFTVITDLVVGNAQTVSGGTYRNITVASGGVLTLGGAVVADGAVLVQAGGTLNTNCQALTGAGSFTLAAGGTLGICDLAGIAASGSTGAVRVTGPRAFSPDASYVYNGGDSQVTGSGLPGQVRSFTTTNNSTVRLSKPLAISQVLTVGGAGNFDLSGQALTLLSGSAGSALVVNSGTGLVSGGTATVQRYLDPAFNTGMGYRHYSAPVSGSTVADLATPTGFTPAVNVTYNTSAAPGSVTPFPTVFGYDQSRLASATSNYPAFDKGFYSPSDLTDELVVGQGYAVQIGADQLVDFTGQLNTGTKTLALGRNADATAAEAGWALVGNPYPAPLDWSQVAPADRANLDGSIYVVQSTGPYTGSYRAYVNNMSTSGTNSPLIGTGQGFFVRVSAGQSSGTLTFRNSQRVTDYASQAPVYRTTADPRPLVQLELRTNTGQADGLAVYAETGATPSYDAQYDAGKLVNSTGLNLASLSAAQEPLAIDGRPAFTAATVVPLTVGVPAAGTYSLAVAALANIPAGLDAYLTDAQTGQTVRLGQQSSYSFRVTAAESVALLTGRFTLSFKGTAPLATVPAVPTSTEVALYPNPASERFTVLMPAVAGASQVQATLANTLGQVVRRQAAALPTTGATLLVETAGLPTGVYTLRLQAGATTLNKRLIIK